MSKTNTATPTTEIAPTETRDPWSQVDQLFREFHDSFFSTLRSPGLPVEGFARIGEFAPALSDVSDLGESYEIAAELPGIARDQIDVRVVGNSVHISAQQKAEQEEKRKNYLRRERVWSGYSRSIELPEPVRSDDVRARYEDGELTVTVPKAQPIVERKVAVQ